MHSEIQPSTQPAQGADWKNRQTSSDGLVLGPLGWPKWCVQTPENPKKITGVGLFRLFLIIEITHWKKHWIHMGFTIFSMMMRIQGGAGLHLRLMNILHVGAELMNNTYLIFGCQITHPENIKITQQKEMQLNLVIN